MKQGTVKVEYFCPSKATFLRNVKQNVFLLSCFATSLETTATLL